MIERLCIVGVGLIGGSLARALRRAGAVAEVVGTSRREAHLLRARELGVIDRFLLDPAEAVRGADVVVVCTPMGAMEAVFRALRPGLAPDAVLTDAGSVKQTVFRAARAAFGRVPPFLVPAHPIAGTEHSGVEASFASLFEGRRVILTPGDAAAPAAVDRVEAMWRAAGAETDRMAPDRHDEVLASVSHLPHLLAYVLVDLVASGSGDPLRYAAGGFRDFSRIASSDPVMWRDICLENREAIAGRLDAFQARIGELAALVRARDGAALHDRFARAKGARDTYVEGSKR
ncbi:MAG: prephenate dehydrogenase/arogenate dehydrogenase family protein [Immundisolibacterales bacterium]|nr:prephenate dehydrogenase/arogenate dehydrogenase family protein [Immundisolibacterales bacterium]